MKVRAELFRKTKGTNKREGLSKRRGEGTGGVSSTYVNIPLYDTRPNIQCIHTYVSIPLYDTGPNVQCIHTYLGIPNIQCLFMLVHLYIIQHQTFKAYLYKYNPIWHEPMCNEYILCIKISSYKMSS